MLAAALLSVGHSGIFVVWAPHAKKRLGAASEQTNGLGCFTATISEIPAG